ncbi:Stealth CR1 domain-containing protein [Psychromonas sp. PT13]|uniref:Stealth CR1 domain-containing protein n=1 Tax=Psychromonas sp. PT13 TaxID=3439547 RepID=UPI003EBEE4EE
MPLKIDFVVPWVDPTDEEWQKQKEKYSKESTGDKSNKRFQDLETLKYVFRSIEKNCPWYNKIFLITCGHVPKWLDINHPKVVIVTHDELYFDKGDLPTFNSQSIEMNLPNLKGLSEHFIYLNDDFIIMNKLNQGRFFIQNKPIDFISHGWIKRGNIFQLLKGYNPWIKSLNNCLNLINSRFSSAYLSSKNLYHSSYDLKTKVSNFLLKNVYKKILWLEHWHHPQPYLLSELYKVHNEFSKEMKLCSNNKFRSDNDLLQYIYRYWHLASNNFTPYKHNDGYVLIIRDDKSLKNGLSAIVKNENLNFVCFNDQMTDAASEVEFNLIKTTVQCYLKKIFPKKSSFENLSQ